MLSSDTKEIDDFLEITSAAVGHWYYGSPDRASTGPTNHLMLGGERRGEDDDGMLARRVKSAVQGVLAEQEGNTAQLADDILNKVRPAAPRLGRCAAALTCVLSALLPRALLRSHTKVTYVDKYPDLVLLLLLLLLGYGIRSWVPVPLHKPREMRRLCPHYRVWEKDLAVMDRRYCSR